MADAVTSQKIFEGNKTVIYKFTNVSDGNGESAVLKVDVSGLASDKLSGRVCNGVVIERVDYAVSGMQVQLLWDATTDVVALVLQGDGFMDLRDRGGIVNNSGSGKTGDLLLTTVGHTSGDTYSIVLTMKKTYG